MRGHRLGSLVLSGSLFCAALAACGGSEPPPAAAPAPAPMPEIASASAAPADTTPPPPPEPTPEEAKKAKAAKELREERAKWEGAKAAEIARWTPDVRAAAKALTDKAYPTLAAALKAVLAGPQRKPGDAERDKFRHPQETLAFFGLRPNMTVLEVGPGEGWYTAILAPTLAAKGKLYDTASDPNGPDDSRSTLYGQRWQAFVSNAPEVYGKVQTVIIDGKAPSLASIPPGSVDEALLIREVHGLVSTGSWGTWLGELHKVLKTGGTLGIVEHRAKPDADPMVSAKQGYVPEKWVIDQVTAAGFKLAGKSEINANTKDTKDYPEGVWALPPSLERGEKDRDAMKAIGESDRMTLKFVKTADAAAAKKK